MVRDITIFIEIYGCYLKILDVSWNIIKKRKLAKWVRAQVTIKAIAHEDPVARQEVLVQCRTFAAKFPRIRGASMDNQVRERIAQRAAERVSVMVRRDIEDTEGPMLLKELCNFAVDQTFECYFSEHNIAVPLRIARRLMKSKNKYEESTHKFRAILRLYLGNKQIEDCSPLLRLTFRMLTEAQMRIIALAYYDGRRVSSTCIAQDLQALTTDAWPVESVEANLSAARSKLRRNVQDQFIDRIADIVNRPGGTGQAERVFVDLCQEYIREHRLRVNAGFGEALHNLLGCIPGRDPTAIQASVTAFCHEHLQLVLEHAQFLEHIVCLLVAIYEGNRTRMERICTAIYDDGIPDPREHLFSSGVKMVSDFLWNASSNATP